MKKVMRGTKTSRSSTWESNRVNTAERGHGCCSNLAKACDKISELASDNAAEVEDAEYRRVCCVENEVGVAMQYRSDANQTQIPGRVGNDRGVAQPAPNVWQRASAMAGIVRPAPKCFTEQEQLRHPKHYRSHETLWRCRPAVSVTLGISRRVKKGCELV